MDRVLIEAREVVAERGVGVARGIERVTPMVLDDLNNLIHVIADYRAKALICVL